MEHLGMNNVSLLRTRDEETHHEIIKTANLDSANGGGRASVLAVSTGRCASPPLPSLAPS